jgi:hypothetical protein
MSPPDMEGGPAHHRPPEGPTARSDSRNLTPTVRPGVYTKPLPLRARDLPTECWWLKSQPWAEEHLARLAGAWDRVYGEAA